MINIKTKKEYNKVNELLDRVISMQEEGELNEIDYKWCDKVRMELYESISIYNNYTNEYKGGHQYGEKKE